RNGVAGIAQRGAQLTRPHHAARCAEEDAHRLVAAHRDRACAVARACVRPTKKLPCRCHRGETYDRALIVLGRAGVACTCEPSWIGRHATFPSAALVYRERILRLRRSIWRYALPADA